MSTPTPIVSKKIKLFYDSKQIFVGTGYSRQISTSPIEYRYLNDDALSYLPDSYSTTISIDGYQTSTTDGSTGTIDLDDLVYDQINQVQDVSIYLYPDISSNKYLEGKGFISNISDSGAAGDVAQFTVDFQISGSLTIKTRPS